MADDEKVKVDSGPWGVRMKFDHDHAHEWRLLYVTPGKGYAKFYCVHCLKQTQIKIEHGR